MDIELGDNAKLALLTSGNQCAAYADHARNFDWPAFFRDHGGGATLERWRAEWKKSFDFVLVDSRTGITDAGGVCTILLPDVLVFVFAANEQSFARGKEIVFGVQKARRELAVRRPPAAVLPLLGRFDGR